MKSKKKKLLISLLILVSGILFNFYFSTIIHQLLSKQMAVLKIPSLIICIHSMAVSKQHLLLFLCLDGLIVLFSMFYYVANNKPYQSDLREITPKISTPVPAGQKQFGSAEWLEKEKDSAFNSFILNANDITVKVLIRQGYDDLKEMKKGWNEKSEREDEEEKEQEKSFEGKEQFTMEGQKGDIQRKSKVENSKCSGEFSKAFLPQGGIVLGCKNHKGSEKIYFIGEAKGERMWTDGEAFIQQLLLL
ncbi:hypothetical protein CLOACE_13570 [Clostridium acetireducens DSM 10703]|uniref:Uncharacterized protein n=1 Tax=Clostridium acetireducens DSM 10703 TaxID=1121290 RepID=A0A1E8EYP8_9CLOT|nr:hypothetical protein CLOACE_13570 [Clostridium acetireducens DSM 10703]